MSTSPRHQKPSYGHTSIHTNIYTCMYVCVCVCIYVYVYNLCVEGGEIALSVLLPTIGWTVRGSNPHGIKKLSSRHTNVVAQPTSFIMTTEVPVWE